MVRRYWQRGVDFDAHEFLDRVVPGHLIGDRRNIIHPIDNRDILVIVEVFAEFLEAAVQVTDVGHGLDDGFPIEGEDQAQRGVRRRVLRPKIQRPLIIFLDPVRPQGIQFFQRHVFNLK